MFQRILRPVRSSSAFSLLEILIVISLIGFLSAYVLKKVADANERARYEATKTQIRMLGGQLDLFKNDCGRYPTTDEGLKALIEKPAGLDCNNYGPKGYLDTKNLPKDGFNKDFSYSSEGSDYEIKSYGSDQKEGGEGYGKDISSKDL